MDLPGLLNDATDDPLASYSTDLWGATGFVLNDAEALFSDIPDTFPCPESADAIDSTQNAYILSSLEEINDSQRTEIPWLPSSPESLLHSGVCSPQTTAPPTSSIVTGQPKEEEKIVVLEPKVEAILSKRRSIARAPLPEQKELKSEPTLPSLPPNPSDDDVKQYKKRMRMIKNRESANLSRKRKREELAGLETQVKRFSEEQAQLVHENRLLRERVQQLEEENAVLRSQRPGTTSLSTNHRPAYLLAICLVTMSLGLLLPSNLFFYRGSLEKDASGLAAHRAAPGRALLAYVPGREESLSQRNVESVLSVMKLEEERKKSEKAENYYHDEDSSGRNSTALMRLPEELIPETDRIAQKLTASFGKGRLPRRTKKRRCAKSTGLVSLDSARQMTSGLSIFGNPGRIDYEAFVKAINRQQDTFYVVSLKDHIVFSGTHNNKTQRPKMAFMMPPPFRNDSMNLPKDEVALLQIDCEVVDTRVLSVPSAILPPH